jgi:hypothetical protein
MRKSSSKDSFAGDDDKDILHVFRTLWLWRCVGAQHRRSATLARSGSPSLPATVAAASLCMPRAGSPPALRACLVRTLGEFVAWVFELPVTCIAELPGQAEMISWQCLVKDLKWNLSRWKGLAVFGLCVAWVSVWQRSRENIKWWKKISTHVGQIKEAIHYKLYWSMLGWNPQKFEFFTPQSSMPVAALKFASGKRTEGGRWLCCRFCAQDKP